MPTDPVLLYALTHHSGLSHGELHDLLGKWRDASGDAPEALLEADRTDREAARLSAAQTQAIDAAIDKLDEARQAIAECETAGLAIVAYDDRRYPRLLAEQFGRARPPLLFCAGSPRLLRAPAVSIIGSRKPSTQALSFTTHCAEALSERGVTVVSGYAQGVDQRASHAALDAGGTTVLVLAQGILTFARERDELSHWIDEGVAAAVSAFEPRAAWQTPLAMARNAIITAMSLHTVTAHAGTRGGAWEASCGALKQGRHVWVRDDEGPGLGHHRLADLGAHLLTWPSTTFDDWADAVARDAHRGAYQDAGPANWTEEDAAALLREGSPGDIHDVTGLTGKTLLRIVEARGEVDIQSMADLRAVAGIGPGTIDLVRQAFGLPRPMPSDSQLQLFPEVSEFPGWDGDLASSADDETPRPQTEGPQADSEPPADSTRIDHEEILALSDMAPGKGGDPKVQMADAPETQEKHKPPAKRRRRKRNLLLILASGMRADALGCAGHPTARTPHIDALAWSGARCARAYTPVPRAAPARAGILTGSTHRVHRLWTDGASLPETTSTLATHLAAQGYKTAFVGEMHFSAYNAPAESHGKESTAYWQTGIMDQWGGPLHGFNQVRLAMGHGRDALEAGHYGRWIQQHHPSRTPSLTPCPGKDFGAAQVCPLKADPGSHVSAWTARTAVELMREMREGPFFLACSFPMPHAPYAPLAEDFDPLEPEEMPLPVGDARDLEAMPDHYREAWLDLCEATGAPQGAAHPSPEHIAKVRAAVQAMNTRLDLCVGRILRQLTELRLDDSTLIVFASDHGDMLGDHGLVGCGPWHYESLVRVPLVWNLPGAVVEGRRIDTPVSLIDIAPTALALIDAEPMAQAQGIDIAEALASQAESPRSAALVESPPAGPGEPAPRTIVTTDRKMTVYPGQDAGEFFNLKRDPEERNNRYASLKTPERLEMLDKMLGEIARTDVPGAAPPWAP